MIHSRNGILLSDKKKQNQKTVAAAGTIWMSFKNMQSLKRQTKEHIMYESSYMKFENRQNESMVMETKPLFVFVGDGTGQDMTWEGYGKRSGLKEMYYVLNRV